MGVQPIDVMATGSYRDQVSSLTIRMADFAEGTVA